MVPIPSYQNLVSGSFLGFFGSDAILVQSFYAVDYFVYSSLLLFQGMDENNARNQYSIPGILHFIQHEWARFEMERSQWEVEKAELQARIAFLQGERKGQENLKTDLVRRIKMLEYALKQERAKYAKVGDR